jgi:hypothetical protein
MSEATHIRGVGVHVQVADEMVDEGKLGAPVVSEAAQVRDDERHVRVVAGQEFDDGDLAHHVVQHRQPEPPRRLAHLPGDVRVNDDAP